MALFQWQIGAEFGTKNPPQVWLRSWFNLHKKTLFPTHGECPNTTEREHFPSQCCTKFKKCIVPNWSLTLQRPSGRGRMKQKVSVVKRSGLKDSSCLGPSAYSQDQAGPLSCVGSIKEREESSWLPPFQCCLSPWAQVVLLLFCPAGLSLLLRAGWTYASCNYLMECRCKQCHVHSGFSTWTA